MGELANKRKMWKREQRDVAIGIARRNGNGRTVRRCCNSAQDQLLRRAVRTEH